MHHKPHCHAVVESDADAGRHRQANRERTLVVAHICSKPVHGFYNLSYVNIQVQTCTMKGVRLHNDVPPFPLFEQSSFAQ